ncbi:M20/M25/M40 family metallo-hydrolase [Micromonospora sp. BRA006-A]|nr:M20/M25/M40 family metallo-hydrolase [Micromonospora sp. BRA006-A]
MRRLAAFGTRHTPSSQTDPVRGIGAARDWIHAQLSGYAAASGGRMSVELQSYVQQPASRIPVPTTITNVVATLRGDVTPERVYVITGHYDSRATDVMDAVSDAPGADDDASGVAVVMELARVLSTRRTEATIVLAAVAAEEQGLYGSAYLAAQLKAAGADIQGMFSNDIVGSSTADDGTRDPRTVRLFAEGKADRRDPGRGERAAVRRRRERPPSRQVARFVTDVAENSATGMDVRVIYRRDRHRAARPHLVPARGLAGRPVHRAERGLRPPAPGCAGRRRRAVRRPARVLRLRLHHPGGAGERRDAVVTGPGAGHTQGRHRGDHEPDERHHAAVAARARAGPGRVQVVWRETTADRWQKVLPVGDVTEVTIDLSKDNVFFGVRAVDRDGTAARSPSRSPAAEAAGHRPGAGSARSGAGAVIAQRSWSRHAPSMNR